MALLKKKRQNLRINLKNSEYCTFPSGDAGLMHAGHVSPSFYFVFSQNAGFTARNK